MRAVVKEAALRQNEGREKSQEKRRWKQRPRRNEAEKNKTNEKTKKQKTKRPKRAFLVIVYSESAGAPDRGAIRPQIVFRRSRVLGLIVISAGVALWAV